jgi:hypothetical protein
MRNPIQSSPQRPIPLPDCILMDAWWADRSDKRSTSDRLRLDNGAREEGQIDRHNRSDNHR